MAAAVRVDLGMVSLAEPLARAVPFDWANWCNNFKIHSTLGCMSPVEFWEAGLTFS